MIAYNRRTLAISLTAFETMKGRDTLPAAGISTPWLQRITDMLHTYLDDNWEEHDGTATFRQR